MIYDSTSNESFEQLQEYWAIQVKENCAENTVLCVAASKVDWSDREEVSIKEASDFCRQYNAKLY